MLAQGGPFLGFITWTSRGINIDLPWNFMKLHVFVVIGPQVLWLERYLASVQFRNGDAIPQRDKLRAWILVQEVHQSTTCFFCVIIGTHLLTWLERYHAYVQFRNGDAIPQLDKLRAARSINNAVKYLQRSCKTEKAQA